MHSTRLLLSSLGLALVAALALLGGSAKPLHAAPNYPGQLDPTFADGGYFHYIPPNPAYILKVAPRSDGIITILVWTSPSDLLLQLTADGQFNTSSSNAGIVPLASGSHFTDMAVQADNRVVLAGKSGNDGTLLARYNADGTIDESFGDAGTALTLCDNMPCSLSKIALQPDGKILALGNATSSTTSYLVVMRFNTDGSLDSGFGAAGLVNLTRLSGDSGSYYSIIDQPDGDILISVLPPIAAGGSLLRLNADGSFDSDFGVGGRVAAGLVVISNFAVQADNKILAIGGSVNLPRLKRWNADGTIDSAFGANGAVSLSYIYPYALAVQNDGKIVVSGIGRPDYKVPVTRFDGSGAVDSTFGDGGIVLIAVPENQFTSASGIAIQADGKLLISIDLNIATLVRLLPDGPPLTATATETPSLTPTVTATPGCRFADVCPGDYFYAAVDFLQARGAISGYDDHHFYPYANMTRSQLVKVVVGGFDMPIDTTGGPHFSDVGAANPFYPFVETAYNRGLLSGYADGNFRGYASTTRGQLSKIVVRAAGWPLLTNVSQQFLDVTPDNPYYAEIETALAHEIVSGYDDGTFKWGNNTTRGQASKMIYLALLDPNPSK